MKNKAREIINEETGRPNKSAMKRQMEEIQDMALFLTDLSPSDFKSIVLPPDIHAEVATVRKISSHGARRRQLRYLVQKIDSGDLEAVQNAVNGLRDGKRVDTVKFKEIEVLRDRVIGGDELVVTEIAEKFPHADIQQLRQLQRNGIKEKKAGNFAKSNRAIFRFIRELYEVKL